MLCDKYTSQWNQKYYKVMCCYKLEKISQFYSIINPFYAGGSSWFPQKTSENFCFPSVFRGYRKKHCHEMG